jgi:hypothetical protein
VKFLIFCAALALVGCGPAPSTPSASASSSTAEPPGYSEDLRQLAALNQEASVLLKEGKADKAGDAITKAQPVMTRLLSVRHPALAAMEAASDLDDLYGRMLLANRHYGWARMQFQKNLARWKNWVPQTPDTERRRKVAESAIAECDRKMVE